MNSTSVNGKLEVLGPHPYVRAGLREALDGDVVDKALNKPTRLEVLCKRPFNRSQFLNFEFAASVSTPREVKVSLPRRDYSRLFCESE